MNRGVNERELVLAILMEVTEKGAYSHLLLRDVLSKYQYLEKKERAFITRVTEGTLEHMIEIDYVLNQFSKTRTEKMKPVIRNILRSAVYQLMYMDTVPDRAVCSEAVRLAERKGFHGLKGFVNGVLRNTARGWREIEYPTDPMEYLSVRYSCPLWLVKLWCGTYGADVTETMLKYFQKEGAVTVRCCADRISSEELKDRLCREGAEVSAHPYLPYALCISQYDYLESLPSFREGLFAVQDVSSMFVGEAAAPRAGDKILDLCAAPGGKTVHLAQLLKCAEAGRDIHETGFVEARDLSERKTELIEDNVRRFGLDNVRVSCADATCLDEAWTEKADIVVADLPCSGLGVLGKKTDLKYRATPEGLEELSKLQRKILSCAQTYVKEGGALIYSTCTVNPKENEENVRWFLEKYPQFKAEDISFLLPDDVRESGTVQGCIRLLPGVHECDGFFIARLRKAEAGSV